MMTSISSINTNAPAMQYQSQLSRSIDKQNTSMERLSSGLKINTAKDDAAGLQISNRLQVQNRGMDVAIRNANDGISVLQTAEGAMNEYTENLMQMRDLALRYANGSLSSEDRESISVEFEELKKELGRITQATSFAGDKLLNGSTKSRSFQVGSSSGEAILIELPDLSKVIEQKENSGQTVFYAPIMNHKVDSWRADPGQRIGVQVVYSEGNGSRTENLLSDAIDGASMEDIVDNLNSKYGDKVNFYLDSSIDKETIEDIDVGKADQMRLCYTSKEATYITIQFRNAPNATQVNNPFWYASGRSYIEDSSLEHPLPSLEEGSDESLVAIDRLLEFVDSSRAYLGASQNRLTHAINNLSQSSENVAKSHSQIRDTDFAKESTQLTKQSILREVNTSMLAQAGNAPKSALNLLS
ncbi:flagellin [Vibrio parahaemolyticus]|uniref:flagellin N-terminal helical domain-containing protein n=1 Tax=Vibrio parahaemolyticus TaxID=670 RepID=UPI0012FA620A|nr:flagellin [Vibrio parahaemolyticus]MUT57590.1 flagellin [Vibrio parahaemolyticus]